MYRQKPMQKFPKPFSEGGIKDLPAENADAECYQKMETTKNQSTPRMMSNDISHHSLLAALL